MITGAHSIIYSTNAEADRAFLRDLLKLTHVDVGDGWLIFGLPPAEVAVHPSDKNDVNEFYLMTDDIRSLLAEMKRRDIACWAIAKNVCSGRTCNASTCESPTTQMRSVAGVRVIS